MEEEVKNSMIYKELSLKNFCFEGRIEEIRRGLKKLKKMIVPLGFLD